MEPESHEQLNDRVYTDCGLSVLEFEEYPEGLVIDRLAVAPEDRGYGNFRCAMEEIVRWADATGTDLFLTPMPMEEGTSAHRLERFYGQLGFVPRRDFGDFGIPATHVRHARPARAANVAELKRRLMPTRW